MGVFPISPRIVVIFLFVSLLRPTQCVGDDDKVLKIGFLVPLTDPYHMTMYTLGDPMAGAFDMAIEHANDLGFVDGYRVEYDWGDSYARINKGLQTIAWFRKNRYHGIIGPGNTCAFEARFASALNMAMIDYLCDEKEVSDKSIYSTYARTKPSFSEIAYAIVEVFKEYNWRRCTIVSSDDPNFVSMTDTVFELFEKNNIEVTNHRPFPGNYVPGMAMYSYDWDDTIRKTRQTTRIYLFLGSLVHHRHFIVNLYKAGVFSRDDTMVVTTSVDITFPGLQGYVKGVFDIDNNDIAMEAIKYSLVVEFRLPLIDYDDYVAFTDQYSRRTEYIFGGLGIGVDNRAFFLYDAVMQLCSALNQTIAEGGDITDGREVMSHVFDSTYQSKLAREAYIDENGDAFGEYELKAWRLYDMMTHFTFGRFFQENLVIGTDYGMIPIGKMYRNVSTANEW
ncbi:speract receptor-like, partial [Saccoglossus kowalevskii]|uniref:Speract receptor-like n=1 Tax=Saccoglossus kowalevskii TaxID=10224 RepID=A0ABM0MQY2_SACKO